MLIPGSQRMDIFLEIKGISGDEDDAQMIALFIDNRLVSAQGPILWQLHTQQLHRR